MKYHDTSVNGVLLLSSFWKHLKKSQLYVCLTLETPSKINISWQKTSPFLKLFFWVRDGWNLSQLSKYLQRCISIFRSHIISFKCQQSHPLFSVQVKVLRGREGVREDLVFWNFFYFQFLFEVREPHWMCVCLGWSESAATFRTCS